MKDSAHSIQGYAKSAADAFTDRGSQSIRQSFNIVLAKICGSRFAKDTE